MHDLTLSNLTDINLDGFTFAVDTLRTDHWKSVAVVNAPDDVKFRYWSGDGYASPGPSDLHITPGYHPYRLGMTSPK
jgi:hypothetical protein